MNMHFNYRRISQLFLIRKSQFTFYNRTTNEQKKTSHTSSKLRCTRFSTAHTPFMRLVIFSSSRPNPIRHSNHSKSMISSEERTSKTVKTADSAFRRAPVVQPARKFRNRYRAYFFNFILCKYVQVERPPACRRLRTCAAGSRLVGRVVTGDQSERRTVNSPFARRPLRALLRSVDFRCFIPRRRGRFFLCLQCRFFL